MYMVCETAQEEKIYMMRFGLPTPNKGNVKKPAAGLADVFEGVGDQFKVPVRPRVNIVLNGQRVGRLDHFHPGLPVLRVGQAPIHDLEFDGHLYRFLVLGLDRDFT